MYNYLNAIISNISKVEQIYQQGSLRGLCCEYPIVRVLFGKDSNWEEMNHNIERTGLFQMGIARTLKWNRGSTPV